VAVSEIDGVLRRMLEVEGQARDLVSQAEKQAKEILAAAREESRRLVEQAKESTTAQSRRIIELAVADAQSRRDEEITAQVAADAPLIKVGGERAPGAVRLTVREIAAL
jgi:vacuolar-type H+-ATPase subunit H